MPVKYEFEPIVETAVNRIVDVIMQYVSGNHTSRQKVYEILYDINKTLIDQDICIALLSLKLKEKIKQNLPEGWSNQKDLDKIKELEETIVSLKEGLRQ